MNKESGCHTILLSELFGYKIKTHDRDLGKVIDAVARFTTDGYPPVTGLIFENDSAEKFLRISDIDSIENQYLYTSQNKFDEFKRRPGELLLKRDIIGHKLVHISQKHHPSLIKAYDLEISATERWWSLTGVIQSSKGKRLLGILPGNTNKGSERVDFKEVEPFMSHVPTSLLKLRYRKIAKIHPSELADLLESTSPKETEELLDAVSEDSTLEADVFEELEDEHQIMLVSKKSDEEIAGLLSNMEPDDAVDLISELDQERREPVLSLMPLDKQKVVRELLSYNPETAGGLMTNKIIAVAPETKVAELKILMSNADVQVTDTIYLVNTENQLTGHVRLVDILKLNDDDPILKVQNDGTPSLLTSADLPEIVTVMSDYNLASLAIVDKNNHLVGAITVDDVLERLIPESWKRRALAGKE
jgi:CBS domain-containing protein